MVSTKITTSLQKYFITDILIKININYISHEDFITILYRFITYAVLLQDILLEASSVDYYFILDFYNILRWVRAKIKQLI